MPSIDTHTLYELRRRLPESVGFESRCVASHDFQLNDPEEGTDGELTIVFTGPPNGGAGTYKYHNFPLSEYALFAQASSLGKYYNDYIKDRYSYERID